MARRYVRDNRGRFSSTGATARGGRLRTAAGNKRATQTARLSGGSPKGTVGKPKGLKPGAVTAKPQVSSARQAATDRLKIKTQTRRAMRADRASVVTPGQRSRLEAGKGATMQGSRPASTVAKPRTAGNTKQQVQSRVERKLAAEKAKMNVINKAERVGATQGNQRERSYKRQATLERAQTFLTTGKLPGKDNSIAAQRSMKQAKERLAAKNAERKIATRKSQLEKGAQKSSAKADRIDAKIKNLESQYRSKDAAFYTQGAKPAQRDKMIAKSQQAAKLREESAALRQRAANAQRMAGKIKDKPAKPTTSSDPRMTRALQNEAAGSTSFRRNPKGYAKRITALTAQKIYKTGDVTAGLTVAQMARRGFRLPRKRK